MGIYQTILCGKHTRVTSFWNENPPVPPNCNALAQESIGILDRML